MIKRTFCAGKMNGTRVWLSAAVLQALLVAASCGNHRRSMATQATMPSKGGWRPVVGSNGLIYSSFGTAPLHAPVHNYKIPVPVLDIQQYASSARPLATKDINKVTSIAQSYRPTTLRTVPTQQPLQQPINSYHNPFALQNHALYPSNALNYYKHVQNYPLDSVVIRNPHNPYAARPVFQKYPQKYKQQQLQNNVFQQLTSIQPIQFGQYQTAKPIDVFGKPIENYARPNEVKKQQSSGIETYKPEVFKLPDSDTASQSLSQQVKTAQQQTFGGQNQVYNTFPQYSFQDAVFPPNILGSFGSFGVQSVKGRDPIFPSTKATFLPQQPTRTTIFNSFNYSPNFKTTPAFYNTPSTTPKLQTTPNQIHFSSTYNDFKVTPTPSTKVSSPPKIDPNANAKDFFKPSPQDPFSKNYHNDFNKVTTYNPIQTTSNNVYEYNYQSQYIEPNYYNQQQPQQNGKYTYEHKKQKIHDSVPAISNQQSQVNKQYTSPTRSEKDATLHTQIRPTYEVTETTESGANSQSSPGPWQLTSQPYDSFKSTEESVKNQEYSDYGRPNPTPIPEAPEEYAIVTEVEKEYQNSLGYDGQVESQSRRPLGDDFEPIGKHKLKDYYYKVSTPTYDDYSVPRRTKKPSESSKSSTTSETTTASTVSSDLPREALPTLPPNKHFKRPNPSTPEPPVIDNDRIRKRNKIRRRRPPLANITRSRDESSTRLPTTRLTFAETTQTETDDVHTIKPRVRPTTNAKLQTQSYAQSTTPTVTTDLTTSALPTISPTAPTIVKKKLVRRPLTTTPSERVEATTITSFKIYEANNESPIMKIANRPQYPKSTSATFEYRTEEAPDYTHKQDEKDTPTSDVSVPDTLRTTVEADLEFAFHKDVKPIEAKLEPVTNRYRETTTDDNVTNEVTTFSPRTETNSNTGKIQRPRLRNKYNRPKFSVKDYKNRLGSTTTTTEKTVEITQKLRFPQRRPYTDSNSEIETTTERKKFVPKEARTKINSTDSTQETYTLRPARQRSTTPELESTTKISARIRNGNRRPKPTEETTEPLPTTLNTRRPLRKKIKDSDIEESVQDIVVTESTIPEQKDITSERTRSESAIMKIADKKHHDPVEHLFEHSKRVSDLTLAASKDYNKPGMFKTVSTNSRRIPNYFTIATDDPILPIEAFFPQLNQKKES